MFQIVKQFAQLWSKLNTTIVLHFSLHFFFQRVMFQKLAQNYIFQFFQFQLLGVLMWLFSCLIILSGDVEVNPGLKKVSVNVCESVTGTSTAYQPMTIPNYFFSRHVYRFANLILFVSYKHILMLLFPLMMTIW